MLDVGEQAVAPLGVEAAARETEATKQPAATIYEGFGTPNEKVTRRTATLVAGKEMHEVATIVVGEVK